MTIRNLSFWSCYLRLYLIENKLIIQYSTFVLFQYVVFPDDVNVVWLRYQIEVQQVPGKATKKS